MELSVGCDDSGMQRDYFVDVDGYLKSGWRRLPGAVNPAYENSEKLSAYKEKYNHFITDSGESNEHGTIYYNEWAYYSPVDYCAVEGWTEIDGKKYFFGIGGHPFTFNGTHTLRYGNPNDGIMLYDTYTPDCLLYTSRVRFPVACIPLKSTFFPSNIILFSFYHNRLE